MPDYNKSYDQRDPQFRITPIQQAAASFTGAFITSLFVTPLDVIKIRLQAQQKDRQRCFLLCNGLMDHICGCTDKKWFKRPDHFKGTIDAFIKIPQQEGVSSLWSGLSPTLILAIPSTIVYFVSYEQLRVKLNDKYNNSNYEQPLWIPLISGATARIFAVTLVNPLELIRTKMQSKKMSYLEIGEAISDLFKYNGIQGLWKGILPTLLRDVPFSAVYWTIYENIKENFIDPKRPNFLVSFIGGAIAGSIAATLTVPFDVVKTHQQIEFGEALYSSEQKKKPTSTSFKIFKDIYRQLGIKGLFTGLTPRLIKVAPACAIMIATFEYSKIFFYRLALQNDTNLNIKLNKKEDENW